MRVTTALPFNYGLSTGFWKFKPSSKINVLSDRRHAETILNAMVDNDTHIETQSDGSFLIYNDDYALLAEICDPALCFALLLCSSLPKCYN
jgi:hypothetical protein